MKITLNDKDYFFPETINDFTVKQYQLLIEAPNDLLALVNISGLPLDTMKKLKKKQVDELMLSLRAISISAKDMPQIALPEKIAGYDMPHDFDSQSYGTYESALHYLQKCEYDVIKFIPYLCAIYSGVEGNEFEKRVEIFEQSNFVEAYAYTVFFLSGNNELSSYFQRHLEEMKTSLVQP